MENVSLKYVDDNKAVVCLKGRLDIDISEIVEKKLHEILKKNDTLYLVINMSSLDYISSSGFQVILSILRYLKSKDGVLALSDLTVPIKRAFDIIEISNVFDIYDTDDKAISSFE